MVYISLFTGRNPSMKVEKWIASEELKKRTRVKGKRNQSFKIPYISSIILYNGCSVPEASEKLGISEITSYN